MSGRRDSPDRSAPSGAGTRSAAGAGARSAAGAGARSMAGVGAWSAEGAGARSTAGTARPAAAGRGHHLASWAVEHWGLAVFLLALVVRCVFILVYGPSAPPTTWGDDTDYDAIARGLAGPAHLYQNTWFPPGYPLFVALIYALGGPQVAAVRFVQAILSAATCWVTYAVGRDAFGVTAGRVAAVLLALYPGHIYMAWRLMAETLFTLLIALALLAAQRAAAGREDGGRGGRDDRGDRRSAWIAAGAGAALGAATLVKSNLLLLIPLMVLWLALAMPGTLRRRTAAAAAMAASCGLLLLASPLANRFSPAHRAAWLPGNGGPTLWWSNNPLADGYFVDPDDSAAGSAFIDRHGLEAASAARDPEVRDRADRQLAWDWIRENPGAFTALAGRKLWNAFGPLPRAALFSREALAARVQALVYGALLPLIAAGIWLSRRRWRQAMPLYLVVGSYAAMTVAFYGTPRFTLVVMPYLLAFAGLAVAALARRRRWRPEIGAARYPEVGAVRLADPGAGPLAARGEA
jgi:4-amino-4-deoxy-L-arabinose transferase-like glycosyltransferase